MSAVYAEPMYTWEEERPRGLNVRWSEQAANSILAKSRSFVLPVGIYLPQKDAFCLWSRLTGGYTL